MKRNQGSPARAVDAAVKVAPPPPPAPPRAPRSRDVDRIDAVLQEILQELRLIRTTLASGATQPGPATGEPGQDQPSLD